MSSHISLEPAGSADQWLLLVNPAAGSGISSRRLQRVCRELRHGGLEIRTIITDSVDQLVDHASMACGRGYTGILVHGGDGTMSHAVSGLVRGKTTLPVTIIPHGSGNDWARTAGISSIGDTLNAVMNETPVLLDAAECIVRDPSGSNIHSSILVNSAGFGLDARVLSRSVALRSRYGLSRTGYLCSLLASIREMPLWEGTLEVDGEKVFAGPYLSLTCGVGPYVGGGMMLSPDSSPVDDRLDTAVVRPISRRNLLKSLPMVYRGNLLEHPEVSSWRGREAVFRACGDLEVELDGEYIPDLPEGSSIVLKSLPSAYRALVSPKAAPGLRQGSS